MLRAPALVCVLGVATLGLASPLSPPNPKPTEHPHSPIAQCIQIANRLNEPTAQICDPLRGAAPVTTTLHGEKLYAFNTGVTPENARVRVLVIGAIHGDETSSAWLAFQWLSASVPSAQLEKRKIAVRTIPIANPDRALSSPIKRVNGRGVDLNRNFPTENWKTEAARWWTDTAKRDPRRWPGNQAASEAETKALIAEIDRFKPSVIVSVHAPFGVLDFDGRGVTPPQRIGALRLDTVGIYPGSLGNYGAMVRGIPVLTLELPAAQRPTTPKEANAMWGDLVRWLDKHETLTEIRDAKQSAIR